MRRTTLLALAATPLLLAGCGTHSSSSASQKVSPVPGGPVCRNDVRLTAADSGRTVCVAKGGEVRLSLGGTKERPWKPVTVTGGALKAINSGLVIRPGNAEAAYHASAPGTGKLTSSRPMCATAPGQMSCKGIQEWTVTVTVKSG
ncbi:hypothetical protein ACFY2H_25310 [Streptomyces griseofuscus]|uniref:DUF4232 domain-containing protein n=1 Tax=Streptomyces griseofuscus TaxID=146922 RepID=A0A7H1Q4F0_9ACTN|nr:MULTISPECIES: hypothetical protein [Streptomyces]MBA9046085.1 hypothetical protein [Streptomyces murinus]QNT95180.1 hypothetical protein HEP81_04913 [Streptomyces griseofuscus]RRQ79581.1 hypothetical protein CQW39_10740 [Streptomyces griseofuscus]BBC95750.1 hypothetical protein SRO_4574 [Streptomyces rochei]